MDAYVQEQIKKVSQQKEQQAKLRNLVEGLLYSFSINPNGQEFIWYFGEGAENSNRAAIAVWVKRTMTETDFSDGEKGILPGLCGAFHDALDDMESRQWV